MDGIIIVNKPKGYTSHDIVNKIRKIYNTKKVGHTGTLDPNATGVLPILIGKATKLSNYLMEHDKTYIATLKLGEQTDTGDSEGKIIKSVGTHDCTIDAKKLKQKINNILKSFIGKQTQVPPMYSAIKVDGKKLYEYARNNETVEIPKREIEIYNIELNSINDLEITYTVECSKGTYIRTLCEDIAKKLGTIGYMKELQRIKVNNFSITDSYTIQEIEENKQKVKLITIEEIFKDKEKIVLEDMKIQLFLNGGRIKISAKDGIVLIYNKDNVFIGTGNVKNLILKRDIIM